MKSEYLNWVALHEAGHAVVAAFLKDSFSYVTIKPSPRKGTVSSNSRGYVFMTPYRGSGKSMSLPDLLDRQMRFLQKRSVSNLAARATVDLHKRRLPKHRRNGFALELSYGIDEKGLEQLMTECFDTVRVSPEAFPEWRTQMLDKARKIVAIPHVSAAIITTAIELEREPVMKSKRVREILKQSETPNCRSVNAGWSCGCVM